MNILRMIICTEQLHIIRFTLYKAITHIDHIHVQNSKLSLHVVLSLLSAGKVSKISHKDHGLMKTTFACSQQALFHGFDKLCTGWEENKGIFLKFFRCSYLIDHGNIWFIHFQLAKAGNITFTAKSGAISSFFHAWVGYTDCCP